MNRADKSEMLTAGIMAVVIIALACAFSGCDVNTKVRPFFWPKEKPPEQVQPAPPAPKPAPPPDDWAPPWFRRPKPERNQGLPVAPGRPRQGLELIPRIPRNDIPNQRTPSLATP